jgi:exonuclease SbcC
VRPLHVWARNYGPYATVDWVIDVGVTAVIGRNEGEGINSNGAGKTRLLEIMPLALFGPSAALAEWVTVGSSDATCEVGFEFEHAGERYRIVRTYTAKGRGSSTTRFERFAGELAGAEVLGGWVSCAHERQDETQAAIERLLAISATTFEQSVWAKQFARHFANPTLPPRERKEILAETLGLGVYDDLQQAAKLLAGGVDTQLTTLKGALAAWEQTLEQRPAVEDALTYAREQVAVLATEERTLVDAHAALQQSYEQARAARGAVAQAQHLVSARAAAAAGFDAKVEAAAGASAAAGLLRDEVAALDEVGADAAVREQRVDALKAAAAERAQLADARARLQEDETRERAAAASLTARAMLFDARHVALEAQLETPADVCDRCGQPVAGEAREKMLAGVRADVERLNAEHVAVVAEAQTHADAADALAQRAAAIVVPPVTDAAELAAAVEQLAEARAALVKAEGLRARLTSCDAAIAVVAGEEFTRAREAAVAAHAAATAELAQLESSVLSEERANELARDTLGAKVKMEEATVLLGRARTDLGAAEQRMRAIEEAAVKAQGALDERAALEARALVLGDLVRAYSRDGIPALIMESTAIPQIEREAQRVLDALGVPFRVELRTQATNKTNDRMKDTLDVVVHEPNGERGYDTYSGGEQARINVALRIALARLLAHRRGASMEVFALDEVEHLDAAGVVKLAELLRDLQREIPVVLFISHVETLTEAFDQTVTVVRDAGGSRLEVAA